MLEFVHCGVEIRHPKPLAARLGKSPAYLLFVAGEEPYISADWLLKQCTAE